MSYTEVTAQSLQIIPVANKGVEAAIQLKSGSLVVAGSDCSVIMYKLEGTQYVQRARAEIAKVPHTIGYDFKREHIYVGCAWGAVEEFDVFDDYLVFVQSHTWSKREISHITYRMDSDTIMSAGFDGQFLVYHPKSAQILSRQKLCDDPIRYIRYDDVGGKIYLGTHKPGIPVFDCKEPEKGDVPEYQYTLGVTKEKYYHKDPVRCVLLDPRSRYMFSCDHAGKILVWHSGKAAEETEKPALGQLDGHLGSKLRSLCWLHQQKALLSAGEDGKIIVHNVGQRKTCGQWQAHTDELMGIEEIQFGIEGSHVMSWSKDGRVQIWRLTFKD
ncbi:WD40_repeat protein [Hexamita inflata]|uniref:WD40 repeat protein n=1 Tax=Hexamita inflata TaxID=28002 RepID=A0AA86TT77_9EUKA|nr:WD40 repeat protein [Hexamita inflata]